MYDKSPLQTLDFHRSMLVDEERCLAFMRAIAALVAAELIEEAASKEAAEVVAAAWVVEEAASEDAT